MSIKELFDALQQSAVLQGIGWLIGVGGFAWGVVKFIQNRIETKWSQFDQRIYSSPFIKGHKEFFIPSHYKERTEDTKLQFSRTSLSTFIDELLLNGREQFIFIEAGTGVGKTTYLFNLFLEYKSRFSWFQKLFRTKPNILLLNYNNLCRELSASDDHINLLKKYRKRAGNTIVLVDALDEFQIFSNDPSNTLEFSKYYTKEFIEIWKKVESYLLGFKKVVLTARSQFLTGDIKDTLNIGKHVELLQFSEKQALEYIDKRKKSIGPKGEYLSYIWYQIEKVDVYLDDQNYEIKLSRLPLILSYIEYISSDIDSYQKLAHNKSINLITILELIIRNWITREVQDDSKRQGRNYGEIEKAALFQFCKELAVKITLNESHGWTINQKEYEELLASKNVSTFRFDDRSLLKKVESFQYGKGVSKNYSYGFVHKAFFEYFLAEFALEQEDSTEYNDSLEQLNFDNHNLGQEVFILKRWEYLIAQDPLSIVFEDTNDGKNSLTIIAIEELNNFFKKFSKNGSIQKALEDRGLDIIEKFDSFGFKNHLLGLRDIEIHGGIFWDFDNKIPYSTTLEFIPVIKNRIEQINLLGTFVLDEMEHFKCFKGIKNLKKLTIHNCNITGKGLQYFAHSKYSLEEISLSNYFDSKKIKDDEVFRVFEGANKLRVLSISFSMITGEGLKYFAKSKRALQVLSLVSNNITNDVEVFRVWDGIDNLENLVLSYNNISGEGLKYFTLSKNKLKALYLNGNNITDEESVFNCFDGANNLREINLGATNINGNCLRFFSKSKDSLITLLLFNNQWETDEALQSFVEFSNLQTIDLSDNQLTGDCIRFFKNSGNSLSTINLKNIKNFDVTSLRYLEGFNVINTIGLNGVTLSAEVIDKLAERKIRHSIVVLDEESGEFL